MRTKRFLALIITLIMCITVFPMQILAAEETVTFAALYGTANNDTANQGYSKLLDGALNSKWCDKIGTVDGVEYIPYIIFKASKPVIITDYTFVTGNDSKEQPGRNPKDWTIYGCNDYNETNKSGGTWAVVHTVSNDTVMQNQNYASYKFTVENNSSIYKYYKLVITANHGAQYNLMQLSEMRIGWRTAYKITFDKNGGDTDAVPTVTEHGSSLPTVNPTRNGYSFEGWYTKNGADGDWGERYTAQSTVSADTTVYAKWSEYQITYSLNDGNEGNRLVLGYGSGMPATEPIRAGFKFIGWYTKNGANGDWGERYTALTTVSSDITVYAKWIEPVTFEVIGGTEGYITDKINEGYENLFDGKNSGDTFTKWCVHENNGYLIIKAKRPVKLSSYTFITGNDNAQYKGRSPKTWILSGCNDYNLNDGTWEEITSVTDDSVIQDLNFTAYTFEANAEQSYMYYKLDIIKNAGNDLLQLCGLDFDYDVTAEYAGALVYFDKNGGDTMPSPQVIATGRGLPTINPRRNGYGFAGWYTQNGADDNWGDSFTAQSTVTADTTVYAKWTAYSITYSMNDGSANNHAVLPYGSTPADPVKSGRDFEGWYTKNGLGGDWGEKFTAQSTVFADITVYAKWGNVKVTFDKNGGDTDSVPTVMEHGSGMPITNPTRNGYRFAGWYTKNGTDNDWGEELTADTELVANTTVYAKWQDYMLTFKMNDGTQSNYGIFGYGSAFPLPIPKKKNLNVSGWYTADGTNDNWGALFSASTAVTADMSLFAKWETSHTHCICGADHKSVGSHTSEELATYKPIGTIEELLNAESGTAEEPRYYYLTADVVIPYQVDSGGNVSYRIFSKNNFVLCLNGHSLSHSYSGYVINVGGSNFTLTDCVGTGKITHSDETKNGRGVYIDGGTFNMYNGNITKNSSYAGAGVYLSCGTFNMYGGTISENSSTSQYGGGGGVATSDAVGLGNSTFNMYGGKITGNTSVNGGGGVFSNGKNNQMNILGGEITGNTSEQYSGGGVCFYNCDVTVNNAVISGNTAAQDGGGIAVISAGKFSIKNSTVKDNKGSDGGGIYVWTNNFEIDNCDITKNIATSDGGGLYTHGDNMSIKNSRFYDNKAATYAGGAYVNTRGTIENTSVLRNESQDSGGLLLSEENTLSKCTIANNKAIGTEGKGGGVWVRSGNVTIKDETEISGNSAELGGGIYFGAETLNLQNMRVSENTAKVNGGGVYVKHRNGLSFNGGVYIYNNILVDKTEEITEEQTTGNTSASEPSSIETGSDDGETAETEVTGVQNNLYLAKYLYSNLSKIKLTADEFETDTGYADTKIGITLEDMTQAFTEEHETDYSDCFIADDLKYAIEYNNKLLKFTEGYAVTFDYGDYVEKRSVVKNTPIKKPKKDPYSENKTFIGWFIGNEPYDFTKSVIRDITVSAKWFDKTNVGVSINADKIYANVPESGAVLCIVLYKDYAQTDTIKKNISESTTLNIEELGINKENVDQISVVLLDSGNNKICDEALLILNVPVFDVVFDKNGGNEDSEPKTLKSDKGMPAVNPTKNGYTFKGWYTKNGTDGDWGTEYTFDTVVKSNLTVYAKWKKNMGSLAFNVVDYHGSSGSNAEDVHKLVDGKKTLTNGTKWCASLSNGFTDGNTIDAVLKSPESVKVSGYTLTTGNDTQEYVDRNPKTWKIYGSNDYDENTHNGTWTELASVTDDTLLPAANYASVHYDITGNNTYYTYYKFEVSAVVNGSMMQLSELEFEYDECEHIWNFVSLTKGTCLTEEYEIRKCSLCKMEEKTIVLPPLGHNSEDNGNCSRCGKLAEVEINGVKYSDFKEAVASIGSTGGSIKLIKDVDIDKAVTISNDVTITIDLNGYILRTQNDSRAVLMVKGTLNITDSRPEIVNKLDTTNYPWSRAAEDAVGNNIKTYSGGVITGGGVDLERSSNGFNMSGGTFAGCIINDYGGVIYNSGVPIVMSGNAAIKDCKGMSAQAIYLASGSLTMNDNALISDCGDAAKSYENSIYCASSNITVTLNGNSSIKKCHGSYSHSIQSYKRATLNANTSGTIDGRVSVNNIVCDDNCTSTTIFTEKVEANNISTGLFYGNVSGTIDTCTVTYKMSDSGNAATYAISAVKSGNKALKPINPTADGKSFLEWKKDGVTYDFNSTITSDITLTAEWLSGDVESTAQLYRALERKISSIKLMKDITISNTIDISYPLTVDLNGYVLKYESENADSYLFNVPENMQLTLKNSNMSRTYKFDTSNEKWVLAASSASGENIESGRGGIIIGNVKNNGTLTVNGCIFACTDGTSGVINNAGTLNMENSIIEGCSGILVNNSGMFRMHKVYILNDNTAADKVINSGTINAYSSTISAVLNNSGTIDGIVGELSAYGELSVYNNVKNTGTIAWGTYYDGITNSGNGKVDGCKVHFSIGGEEYALEVLPSGKYAIWPNESENTSYMVVGWYADNAFTKEWTFDEDTVTEDVTLYAKTMSGEVSNAEELNAAVDMGFPLIKLVADIEVDESPCIYDEITLDLNGHVLSFVSENGYTDSVIYVSDEGRLKIKDSNPTAEHKFDTSNDLWVLASDDASGKNIKTVYGGVITGGMGYDYDDGLYGGGIEVDGQLGMFGGNIIGCSANFGGGICNYGRVGMENVNIAGCTSTMGGGIYNEGYLEMVNVSVSNCTTVDYGTEEGLNGMVAMGGGIHNYGGVVGTMNTTIESCTSTYGGGIYNDCNSDGLMLMFDTTVGNCDAKIGGGVISSGMLGIFESKVEKCKATEYAGGILNAGRLFFSGSVKECRAEFAGGMLNCGFLNAGGGIIEDDVYNTNQIFVDFDSMGDYAGENETVFTGKIINEGHICDGIYYGEIENITVNDSEGSYTGSIDSPAVTYMNGKAVYAVYVTSGGRTAVLPIEPVKKNCTFDGWYNGDTEYAFNEAVTGNITLNAKWSGEGVAANAALEMTQDVISPVSGGENARLYVGAYKQGKLVSMAAKAITDDSNIKISSLNLDISEADTLKAFLWDNNMKPLCASVQTPIINSQNEETAGYMLNNCSELRMYASAYKSESSNDIDLKAILENDFAEVSNFDTVDIADELKPFLRNNNMQLMGKNAKTRLK